MKKTVVFDFDGVINSYVSGWKGIDNIPDPPVKGIGFVIERLRNNGYEVIVVSTRCSEEKGIKAIEEYLDVNNIIVDKVQMEKPPCIVTVDDRAICFNGDTENLCNEIFNFKAWWEKTEFFKCYLFGEPCLFINTQTHITIPNMNKLYYMSMDDSNYPTVIGTDMYPGLRFYGRLYSNRYLFKNQDYTVVNGEYFLKLHQDDFELTPELMTIPQYDKMFHEEIKCN